MMSTVALYLSCEMVYEQTGFKPTPPEMRKYIKYGPSAVEIAFDAAMAYIKHCADSN